MGLMKKTLGMRYNFKASDDKMVKALSTLSDMGKTDTLGKIDISMHFGLYLELAEAEIYEVDRKKY